LGFSRVLGFFPLGFGGPVGVLGLVSVLLGALLYSQVSFGGFSYFVEVSNMLVRGFLVGFLGFLCGLAEFASLYTSRVLRGALRFFFNEIILLIKKKSYVL
jgi:hypothetical protein